MTNNQKIEKALQQLIKNDIHLLEENVNERSLTHLLAKYLEPFYPEYNIDCEYNRDVSSTSKNNKKQIEVIQHIVGKQVKTDSLEGKSVYPDIIIHRRGTNDNYLVMEAKKSSSSDKERDKDKKKLEKYKYLGLGYKNAFFVDIPVGKELANYKIDKCITEIFSS